MEQAEKFHGYKAENPDLRSAYHDALERLRQKPIVLSSTPKGLESISQDTVDSINSILFTFSPNEVTAQIDAAKKGEFRYIALPGILVDGAFQIVIFRKDNKGNLKLTYDGVYRAPGSYPNQALNDQTHGFLGYGYEKALDFFKSQTSWQPDLIKDNWFRVYRIAEIEKDPTTGVIHSTGSYYYASRHTSINEINQIKYDNERLIQKLLREIQTPEVQDRINSLKSETINPGLVLCPKTQTLSRIVADELKGSRQFFRPILSRELVELAEKMGLPLE